MKHISQSTARILAAHFLVIAAEGKSANFKWLYMFSQLEDSEQDELEAIISNRLPAILEEIDILKTICNHYEAMGQLRNYFIQFIPTKMQLSVVTGFTASVINSLSVESAAAVNEFMTQALNAGAKEPNEAKDYGFMQQRSMEDLDGHLWEVLYLDMTRFPQQ